MKDKKLYFIKNNVIQDSRVPISYVLDSNVVMKLRDVFYNPSKISEEELSEYYRLLMKIQGQDVVPGFAIRELAWDYEKKEMDSIKTNRLVYAMDRLLTYNQEEMKRIFHLKEATTCPENSNVTRGKKKFNGIYENKDVNIFLLPTFAALLKFHILLHTEGASEAIFKKYVEFIIKEHKMNTGYEFQYIIYKLFGKEHVREKVEGLLKLNGKISGGQSIWNASWDLFFIRILNDAASRFVNNRSLMDIYNPILVTMDKNLAFLCQESIGEEVSYEIIDKEFINGMAISEEVIASSKYMDLIIDEYTKIRGTNAERVEYFRKVNQIEFYERLILNLENELNRCIHKK